MKRLRYSPAGILLPNSVDGRSRSARRFRRLAESYSTELGGDLSEGEKSLIRQIVSLQIYAEEQQARAIAGQDVGADELIRLNSEHRRLLGALGKRAEAVKATKPDGPTLDELFATDEDIE
jgi:hypothetical protein